VSELGHETKTTALVINLLRNPWISRVKSVKFCLQAVLAVWRPACCWWAVETGQYWGVCGHLTRLRAITRRWSIDSRTAPTSYCLVRAVRHITALYGHCRSHSFTPDIWVRFDLIVFINIFNKSAHNND